MATCWHRKEGDVLNDYKSAIHNEMISLANAGAMFLGQQINPEDFYGTLAGISKSVRMEMPVAEELQTGIAIGMALRGVLNVSIYQRMDFLLRAADQIVNHLGLIKQLSNGKFDPHVILRTTVGSHSPLDVGAQHNKDLTSAFEKMCTFPVIQVKTANEVRSAYKLARKQTVLIIEMQDLYGD